MTIRGLVVDDHASVRDAFLRAVTAMSRVEVRVAATVTDALALLDLSWPSFVVVELCLGANLSSREGMRVIYAAKELTPHVAVFTSAELDADIQCELADIGILRFRKPMDANTLLGFFRRRVLRGAPLAKTSPTAIRHAGEALWQLGAPLDQNFDLAEREAIAVGLEQHEKKKLRVAEIAGVHRRFVDRHLTPEWEEHFRRELAKASGAKMSGVRRDRSESSCCGARV